MGYNVKWKSVVGLAIYGIFPNEEMSLQFLVKLIHCADEKRILSRDIKEILK